MNRLLVRSAYHYVHGVVGVGELVGGELGRVDREELISVLTREMALETPLKAALFPDLQRDLLKIDEVCRALFTSPCNTGCKYRSDTVHVHVHSHRTLLITCQLQ